jgi:streptogramin lyase
VAAEGRVWYLTAPEGRDPFGPGVYLRSIDLQTGKRTYSLVNRTLSVAGNVRGMTYGSGSLWIGDTVNSDVYRLDLRTGDLSSYHVRGLVDDVEFGDGWLWVIDVVDGSLTRIDPRTKRAEMRSLNSSGQLYGLAFGDGYVWVTDRLNNELWRVSTDLADSRRIQVGIAPENLVYEDGSVWVANYGDDTISRVDPSVAIETSKIHLSIHPRTIAVSGGKLWVTGYIAGAQGPE